MLIQRFGGRLAALRRIRNLTQAQLAGKARVRPQYLGTVERGLSSVYFKVIQAICKAGDVEPASLLLLPDGAPRWISANPAPGGRKTLPPGFQPGADRTGAGHPVRQDPGHEPGGA